MTIFENINRLTSYALLNGLITEDDVIYTQNRLLELFKLDGFEEPVAGELRSHWPQEADKGRGVLRSVEPPEAGRHIRPGCVARQFSDTCGQLELAPSNGEEIPQRTPGYWSHRNRPLGQPYRDSGR